MKRFDKKGMMIYPNPKKKTDPCQSDKVIVVEECYCQAGHSLISSKVKFDGFDGIMFDVERSGEKGKVAVSPVYGCNHRIVVDVDFKDGDVWDFHCPECGVALPFFTICECGAYLTTFFTNKDADFNGTIAICNRVGCQKSEIYIGEKLLFDAMLKAL